jgi:hypothetical protein
MSQVRAELPDTLRSVLDRDVQRGSGSAAKSGRKPSTYAAAAAQASVPAAGSASPPMPPPSAAAPPTALTAPTAPWQQPGTGDDNGSQAPKTDKQ